MPNTAKAETWKTVKTFTCNYDFHIGAVNTENFHLKENETYRMYYVIEVEEGTYWRLICTAYVGYYPNTARPQDWSFSQSSENNDYKNDGYSDNFIGIDNYYYLRIQLYPTNIDTSQPYSLNLTLSIEQYIEITETTSEETEETAIQLIMSLLLIPIIMLWKKKKFLT